jgi:hypothetical protein
MDALGVTAGAAELDRGVEQVGAGVHDQRPERAADVEHDMLGVRTGDRLAGVSRQDGVL